MQPFKGDPARPAYAPCPGAGHSARSLIRQDWEGSGSWPHSRGSRSRPLSQRAQMAQKPDIFGPARHPRTPSLRKGFVMLVRPNGYSSALVPRSPISIAILRGCTSSAWGSSTCLLPTEPDQRPPLPSPGSPLPRLPRQTVGELVGEKGPPEWSRRRRSRSQCGVRPAPSNRERDRRVPRVPRPPDTARHFAVRVPAVRGAPYPRYWRRAE